MDTGEVESCEVTVGNVKWQFGAKAVIYQVKVVRELVWFLLKLLFVVIVPAN